jgi:hypothetical protein
MRYLKHNGTLYKLSTSADGLTITASHGKVSVSTKAGPGEHGRLIDALIARGR